MRYSNARKCLRNQGDSDTIIEKLERYLGEHDNVGKMELYNELENAGYDCDSSNL